jgi:hypothetical protein
MNEIIVEEVKLPQVKYWNGQRVVTFDDVDCVHERPKGTSKRSFNSNKRHFIKDVDYFETTREELRTKFVPNSEPLKGNPKLKAYLLTETGYLMIVKSFTDDLSWEVQRRLVNGYFRAKEEIQPTKVEQIMKSERFRTSNSVLPKNPNWYKRNFRRMAILSEKIHMKHQDLFDVIKSVLMEEYDFEYVMAKYEEEVGHSAESIVDLINYFPQLAETATKYIEYMEREHLGKEHGYIG